MNADPFFTRQMPKDSSLSALVDYFFYIDTDVSQLPVEQEFIIPFPRITFGYFFDHPFLATNHSLNESVSVNMVVSRISTDKITVQPLSDRLRIIGAHLQPYALACLTNQKIQNLPWLVGPEKLFQESQEKIKQQFDKCREAEELFTEMEGLLTKNVLVRDLSLITKAIKLINESAGEMKISDLAREMGVSPRTIRSRFHDHIGCAPKEYARLVKLKQIAWQLKHSPDSLPEIAHDNHYFDQAHFIHDMRNITGKAPKELKKEIPHFRFLQF